MINKELDCWIAVISHKRPEASLKIQNIIGIQYSIYVNNGEKEAYEKAGHKVVHECGTNICQARNKALEHAKSCNVPCIQISDDLKSIKIVSLQGGKHVVEPCSFKECVETMLCELIRNGYVFGGVAVTTNRLNYTGVDFSYDKLIVNDLICMMPQCGPFDETMALKEDYDMSIRQLLNLGGMVRCNQFLCDFPHRDNDGGANTYRNTASEAYATEKLKNKWGNLIKKHPTREGQVALNYSAIEARRRGQTELF